MKSSSKRDREVVVVRAICVGSSNCGLTSIVRRFCYNSFDDDTDDAEGVENFSAPKFHSKLLLMANKTVRFQTWDVPSLVPAMLALYCRSASLALISFDLNDEQSLDVAEDLYDQLRDQTRNPNVVSVFALVGTKSDSGRRLSKRAYKFASDHGMLYGETSSKADVGVQSIFLECAASYLDSQMENVAHQKLMAPPWVPDRLRSKCQQCNRQFSLTVRRHHCRNCSEIFCSKCSSRFIPIKRFGFDEPVRCCDECFELLDGY